VGKVTSNKVDTETPHFDIFESTYILGISYHLQAKLSTAKFH